MASRGNLCLAVLLGVFASDGVFGFMHMPQLRGFEKSVSKSSTNFASFKRLVATPPAQSMRRKQNAPKMMHDMSWIADNLLSFAQGVVEGGSGLEDTIEDIIDDLEAIPGTGVTEVLEEGEKGGAGSVRSSIVALIFKNPLLKALLGTQAGWGLVLVFSLIVIGQAFEMLKETISKSLPERLVAHNMRKIRIFMIGRYQSSLAYSAVDKISAPLVRVRACARARSCVRV